MIQVRAPAQINYAGIARDFPVFKAYQMYILIVRFDTTLKTDKKAGKTVQIILVGTLNLNFQHISGQYQRTAVCPATLSFNIDRIAFRIKMRQYQFAHVRPGGNFTRH